MNCKKCNAKFSDYDKEYFSPIYNINDALICPEIIKYSCPICRFSFFEKINKNEIKK